MFSRAWSIRLSLLAALGLLAVPGFAQSAPQHRGQELAERLWYNAEKQPLPFHTDEEVMEFLRTAKPGRTRGARKGTMGVRRVDLKKDGIEARAYFRDMRIEKSRVTLASGKQMFNFRDDWVFECAAYELGRLLGLHNIPPTVERRLFGKKGSLQIALENRLMDEEERQRNNVMPPDAVRWNRQVQVMRVFDNLIYNFDRNQGNIIIDDDWNIWLIDHGRAFRRETDLMSPGGINQCERDLFERLKALDAKEVEEHLDPFLRGYELEALIKRRDKLVEHIEALIEQRGESQVLFDW